jgi:DNA-binding response OmpR family regulator
MSKTILIADDDPLVRELVKEVLAEEGYRIFEAGDGIEALQKTREILPDLVILDVVMPGIVGYEVCRALKNDPLTRHIFILFLSGRPPAEAKVAVKRNGGDEFVSKPFDVEELRTKIRLILSQLAPCPVLRFGRELRGKESPTDKTGKISGEGLPQPPGSGR